MDNTWKMAALGLVMMLAVGVGVLVIGGFSEAAPSPLPTEFSSQALRDELDNDPKGYGYASLSHQQAAWALNKLRAGEIVTRERISVQELQAQVLMSEYFDLSPVDREAWAAVLLSASDGGVDISNQAIRDQATAIWTVGTTTRANLMAIQTETGSRAEALWGAGFIVTTDQVDSARLLP